MNTGLKSDDLTRNPETGNYVLRAKRPVAAPNASGGYPVPGEGVIGTPRGTQQRETGKDGMQAEMERWLTGRGYVRMTDENYELVLKGGYQCIGFFAHFPEARGNPQVPDLMLFSWPEARPPLLLELKAGKKAGYQRGQKAAIALRFWKVAFSAEEAKRLVEEWER